MPVPRLVPNRASERRQPRLGAFVTKLYLPLDNLPTPLAPRLRRRIYQARHQKLRRPNTGTNHPGRGCMGLLLQLCHL